MALCRGEAISQDSGSPLAARSHNALKERRKAHSFTIPDPASDGIEFVIRNKIELLILSIHIRLLLFDDGTIRIVHA